MMLDRLREWFRARLAEEPDSRIVAAVSGGADSVALAAALALLVDESGVSASSVIVIAHFDHQLRDGADHARDLAVVRRLARRCGVPLVSGCAQAGTIEADAHAAGGLESAARGARYRFLAQVCRSTGARTVCTAHHADDQVETVLMRLLAGQSGIQLAGIPNRRNLGSGVLLCRPLLTTERREIDAFLAELNLEWSEDRSNDDPRYRRNQIRTEILPAIECVWPAVRRDLRSLAFAMETLRVEAHDESAAVPVTTNGVSARIDRRAFYELGREARLDLAYDTVRRLGLLNRCDRPGHRFFEPLLGSDPGRDRRLIGSRGMRVRTEGGSLVFERDIVRPTESRYLRKRSLEG